MIPRPLQDITRHDLEALVINQVAERRTLEFKRELPGNSESQRKEFLADVTSFANAQGGDLLLASRNPEALQSVSLGSSSTTPTMRFYAGRMFSSLASSRVCQAFACAGSISTKHAASC